MAAQTFTVRIMDWSSARPLAAPIRMRVFVEEQQVPAEIELDDMDALSDHAISFDSAGQGIGTGRLLPNGQIGRMAVLGEWRGLGAGRLILETLMARARGRGMQSVTLHAQLQAAPFYAKSGFIASGTTFMEAAIEHVEMHRTV